MPEDFWFIHVAYCKVPSRVLYRPTPLLPPPLPCREIRAHVPEDFWYIHVAYREEAAAAPAAAAAGPPRERRCEYP